MKKYKSHFVKKRQTNEINMNENSSGEPLDSEDNKDSKGSSKPRKNPTSSKKVPEPKLDSPEEEMKINRNASFQHAEVPVPEKRAHGRKSLIQEGSKTISLFRMITLKAKRELSTNIRDDSKLNLPGANTNLFHKSFQKFKSQLADNPDDIKNLKPETKSKINEVIKMEQSIKFRLSRHLMNRLDIFSRFFFPIIFVSWFNFTLFFLDYNWARFVILNMLVIAGVSGKLNFSFNGRDL
jgi:hypothetical protein